jgi:hypothetical protein
MKNVKLMSCLVAAALFLVAGQGFGVIEYEDGGTHNISSTIDNDVRVDSQAPGVPTTINLLNGGTVDGYLLAYGNSRVAISSGIVNYNLYAYDDSQVTMSGGTVSNHLIADNSSCVTISGGQVGGALLAVGNSQITMSGGTVFSLAATGNSQITMFGGTVGGLFAVEHSQIILAGSGFAIDGIPVGLGEIKSILGGFYSNEPPRILTGTLANGDIINNQFQIGDGASIVLVPEPATMVLVGLGGMLAARRRRSEK